MARLTLAILCAAPAWAVAAPAQESQDVPVTIKELDVEGAIREFKSFQKRLGEFRQEITKGREIAQETAQILEELRDTATQANNFNEGPILQAVESYVNGVIAKQVDLVDFLESQRYRITYYANKMANSVRAEDLAILFGTVDQNEAAITARVQTVDAAQRQLADFVDQLPEDQFDRDTFRPTRAMPTEMRRQLDGFVQRYQQEKNALDLAKKRLQLVKAAQRSVGGISGADLDINSDLLVGQMFGTLDQIRLQMSYDLLSLEGLLSGYSRSSRTQDILEAFQNLVELQGDLEGPSPELSSVLDWLQDSSTRRLTVGVRDLRRPGLTIPRYSDLLREAYSGARADQ